MKNIRLSKSIVGSKEKKALERVLDHGYLGMGTLVKEFEEALASYLGVPSVACVNSGTAALQCALMGIGINAGDEVLVQSLTYVACFQAIRAAGAVPVACEIDPGTVTIDLKDAASRLTRRTKAIMPVHYAGRPGKLDHIYRFAKAHGLRVVEDAAHAFGTVYKNRKIGSFGDVVCFSFDGIKNITSGEGGAVVTRDADVLRFVKDCRLLGVQKDTEKRYTGGRSWKFDVTGPGYRYHMSNLFAAIGLEQLKRLEKEFKPARQRLARRYNQALAGCPGITIFKDDYTAVVPHIYPIRVHHGQRDDLRAQLIGNGIECGIHYYPNHLLSYFRTRKTKFPVTERIYGELLSLPLHPDVTVADQDYIIRTIRSFFKTR